MTVKPAMKARIPRSSFVRTTRFDPASVTTAVDAFGEPSDGSPAVPADGPDSDGAVAPTDAPTGTATGAGAELAGPTSVSSAADRPDTIET